MRRMIRNVYSFRKVLHLFCLNVIFDLLHSCFILSNLLKNKQSCFYLINQICWKPLKPSWGANKSSCVNFFGQWWSTGNEYNNGGSERSVVDCVVYHVGCASHSEGSGQRKWAWAPQGRDYSNDFESCLVRPNFWPLLILFSKRQQDIRTHAWTHTHTFIHAKSHYPHKH